MLLILFLDSKDQLHPSINNNIKSVFKKLLLLCTTLNLQQVFSLSLSPLIAHKFVFYGIREGFASLADVVSKLEILQLTASGIRETESYKKYDDCHITLINI